MHSKNQIGHIGEDLAIDFLQHKGYHILEKNWRYKRAEIDLIAKHGLTLVFIEVKTRSYTFYGQPEDSIDTKKEAFIIDAAQRYMEKTGHNWEVRFDIISIILNKNKKLEKISHFKDAFFY